LSRLKHKIGSKMYNWQLEGWSQFQFDETLFDSSEKSFFINAGKIEGQMSHLSKVETEQSLVDLLVNEAIKSAAIEGEMISRIDLISSIKRHLGYDTPQHFIKDKRSEGFAKLLVTSRISFDEPLSAAMLFEWHSLLMQGAYINNVGCWRNHAEPMQVISGSIGREKIHFEAPPSASVPNEMEHFIGWFCADNIRNPLVKAAVAHLYFESIHPFEDGNGRIGRLIAEKALSHGLGKPVLFSISTIIEAKRTEYYEALKNAQKTLAINEWIAWFCDMVLVSQEFFNSLVNFSIKKAQFFDKNREQLNNRQQKVISRMLAEGAYFEGGMSAKKYMSIAKTTKATATRDLQDLVSKGIFMPENEGRSRHYQVVLH
jgi:Fic family protein